MSNRPTLRQQWTHVLNRLAARRAGTSKPVTAFLSHPEPRSIGSFARGRQLCAGNFVFAGHLVQAPDTSIWDLAAPDAAFRAETHGFTWLDDMVAAADPGTRQVAQEWLADWIARYGRGHGPGWTPDLTGRRLIRWISHALFLMRGQDKAASDAFLQALARQTLFLSRRWSAALPGLPRFEALCGLLYAGLSLEGMEEHIATATRALSSECDSQIDAQGGLPTRNPEDLLEVFTLLSWAAAALADTGKSASAAHWRAIERIAPTLRTLRHADGGLARFHGGGRGLEGRLDSALAASGIKGWRRDTLAMGFIRLYAGRTSVIVDAAPPPMGPASGGAHASTLAFELTSGRRPLIVNCGSGESFGAEWRRAGRATPSHSTLVLGGRSSARLDANPRHPDWLGDGPTDVPWQMSRATDGLRYEGAHDGYADSHGLVHSRQLELTFDGRSVAGEDLLLSLNEAQKHRFDATMDALRLHGIPFDIRFHLHPEVDATLDMNGTAVSMALRSGEIWVFRADRGAELSLQPSVYLEKRRLKPRAAKQIVLSGRAMGYATRTRWSLYKAQENPVAIRDLAEDELMPEAND